MTQVREVHADLVRSPGDGTCFHPGVAPPRRTMVELPEPGQGGDDGLGGLAVFPHGHLHADRTPVGTDRSIHRLLSLGDVPPDDREVALADPSLAERLLDALICEQGAREHEDPARLTVDPVQRPELVLDAVGLELALGEGLGRDLAWAQGVGQQPRGLVDDQQSLVPEQLGDLGPCDDPDSYWAEIRVLFERGARIKQEDPTIIHMGMALVKSAAAGETHLSFDRLFDNVHGWLEAVVVKGQAVGAVRRDLPASLLVSQLWAVSGAMDVWAVQNLTDEMIHQIDFEKATDFTIDLYRRLMEPGEEIGFFWPVNDDGQEG